MIKPKKINGICPKCERLICECSTIKYKEIRQKLGYAIMAIGEVLDELEKLEVKKDG